MKSSSIFSLATFFIGILIFALVIKKIGLEQIADTVSMISPKHLLFLIFLNSLGVVVSIYRWKIILRALEFPVSWTKLTMAKLMGLAINYVTPGVFLGGEPFKALYLKTELDIPLRKSAVSIIIDEALFLGITFIIILIGLAFLLHQALLSQKIILTIFSVLTTFLLIFYLFFRRIIYKKTGEKGFFSFIIHLLNLHKIKIIANLSGKIVEVENSLSTFFKEHRNTLYFSIFLTIIESIMYLLTFWFTILFLGQKINLQSILSIVSIIYVNYLMPIPGALGSLELSQSYIFNLMGMKEGIGLGFTLITRVISIFFVVIGLSIIGYDQIKTLCRKFGQRAGNSIR